MSKVVLGIHGDCFKFGTVNESSACLMKDGRIVASIAEERLSRKKVDGRYPENAIKEVLRIGGITINEVDEVCTTSLSPSQSNYAYLKAAYTTFKDTGVLLNSKVKDFSYNTLYNKVKGEKKFKLNVEGKEFDLVLHDHHMCHAAGAFYASPFDKALVITLDGGGDGLDGGAYYGNGGSLERFIDIPHFQSPGTMYSALTHDLGFKRHRHEGKITGLAAYGNPDPKPLGLDDLIRYDRKKHRFISKEVAAHHKNIKENSAYFHPLIEKHGREDLAAVLQFLFEREIMNFVDDAYNVAKEKGYDVDYICLAGGCFANVKANQRIFDLGHFKDIFVYPAMGDDGLSVGAAYISHYEGRAEKDTASEISDTYNGAGFSNEEIETALKSFKLDYTHFDDIEVKVGEVLADNKIVARFNGRMEYGPRALGNRSIIGAPFDKTINDWLNKKLQRTEFMPFAPSMIEEAADDYLVNYGGEKAAEFMTITYDIKEGKAKDMPAVVHVDNTARPQVVKASANASYHKIIAEFGKRTGIPVVLNTSFNMHEEPIVYTPEDGIRGFLAAELDYLAIGNFLVKHPTKG
jgi:carbamoyltransferase